MNNKELQAETAAQQSKTAELLPSAPLVANPLLPAVFLRELAELMQKHNATLELERCWDNEYDSHAELDFIVDGIFTFGNFYASPVKSITADEIIKLSNGR